MQLRSTPEESSRIRIAAGLTCFGLRPTKIFFDEVVEDLLVLRPEKLSESLQVLKLALDDHTPRRDSSTHSKPQRNTLFRPC